MIEGVLQFFFVLMRTPCFWANGSSQPSMLGNFEFHAMHIISQQFLNSYFNIMWNIFYQIIYRIFFYLAFFLLSSNRTKGVCPKNSWVLSFLFFRISSLELNQRSLSLEKKATLGKLDIWHKVCALEHNFLALVSQPGRHSIIVFSLAWLLEMYI